MKTLILSAAAFAMIGGAATVALAQDAKPAKAAKAAKKKGIKTIAGRLSLYEGQKFEGARYDVEGARPSFSTDFTIGSVAVMPGERWEICEKAKFKEPCMTIDAETTELGRITIRSARPVV